MSLGTHEAIRARRTIHDYAPVPVDEAVVRRALEAAHTAPCHKLTWPWRFTRVGPVAREHLIALNAVLKGVASPEGQLKLRAKMANPAVMLVVSQVRSDNPARAREDYAAVACAVQNLCVSLTADGVGSKWTTGGVTTHPDTYAALHIDPAEEEIVGFVWVGLPAREHRAPERPPVDEVLREVP